MVLDPIQQMASQLSGARVVLDTNRDCIHLNLKESYPLVDEIRASILFELEWHPQLLSCGFSTKKWEKEEGAPRESFYFKSFDDLKPKDS